RHHQPPPSSPGFSGRPGSPGPASGGGAPGAPGSCGGPGAGGGAGTAGGPPGISSQMSMPSPPPPSQSPLSTSYELHWAADTRAAAGNAILLPTSEATTASVNTGSAPNQRIR